MVHPGVTVERKKGAIKAVRMRATIEVAKIAILESVHARHEPQRPRLLQLPRLAAAPVARLQAGCVREAGGGGVLGVPEREARAPGAHEDGDHPGDHQGGRRQHVQVAALEIRGVSRLWDWTKLYIHAQMYPLEPPSRPKAALKALRLESGVALKASLQ